MTVVIKTQIKGFLFTQLDRQAARGVLITSTVDEWRRFEFKT
jgi:hypothetical protein